MEVCLLKCSTWVGWLTHLDLALEARVDFFGVVEHQSHSCWGAW